MAYTVKEPIRIEREDGAVVFISVKVIGSFDVDTLAVWNAVVEKLHGPATAEVKPHHKLAGFTARPLEDR